MLTPFSSLVAHSLLATTYLLLVSHPNIPFIWTATVSGYTFFLSWAPCLSGSHPHHYLVPYLGRCCLARLPPALMSPFALPQYSSVSPVCPFRAHRTSPPTELQRLGTAEKDQVTKLHPPSRLTLHVASQFPPLVQSAYVWDWWE